MGNFLDSLFLYFCFYFFLRVCFHRFFNLLLECLSSKNSEYVNAKKNVAIYTVNSFMGGRFYGSMIAFFIIPIVFESVFWLARRNRDI